MRGDYHSLLVLIVHVYLLQIENDWFIISRKRSNDFIHTILAIKKKRPVYVQKSNYNRIDKLVVNEILDPTVPGKFITKWICNIPMMVLKYPLSIS